MPPARFIETGGHHALEPTVALAVVGALTSSLRLMTNLYILAYRNPFLAAKAVATLDSLTGGRVILGTGAGYLEPEFHALGADFARATTVSTRRSTSCGGRGRVRSCTRRVPASTQLGSRRTPHTRAAAGPADLDRRQRAARHAPGRDARRRLDPHAGAGQVRTAGAHGAARVARRPAGECSTRSARRRSAPAAPPLST